MLKAIVNAGVPVLVFFTMVVVGMELTIEDFRRVARRPGTVVAATVAQSILLPVVGWFLVRCLDFPPAIARGMLLVAACPSGAMANVYTYLARANVALSVTLTAVSCLAAVVTTPLALAALQVEVGESTGFPVPFGMLAGQLFMLLVIPVLVGMSIRRRWPDITERHGRMLLGFSIATLVALLGFIIVQELEQFVSALTKIVVAASLLTALAFGAGWVTGWASGARATDRFTVGMVFVVRNVGIATAIAVTVLGRVEFAVFATAYFLAQMPILVAAVLVYRGLRVGDGNNVAGTNHR
jgi:bile acid:Na+ symporter, BASS family